MRLAIVSALAVNETLTFNDLKRLLQTTDGNLSVHARKLEEARYITCEKSFEGRMPKTEYALTAAGRKAFEKYIAHMEALIRNVKSRGPLRIYTSARPFRRSRIRSGDCCSSSMAPTGSRNVCSS